MAYIKISPEAQLVQLPGSFREPSDSNLIRTATAVGQESSCCSSSRSLTDSPKYLERNGRASHMGPASVSVDTLPMHLPKPAVSVCRTTRLAVPGWNRLAGGPVPVIEARPCFAGGCSRSVKPAGHEEVMRAGRRSCRVRPGRSCLPFPGRRRPDQHTQLARRTDRGHDGDRIEIASAHGEAATSTTSMFDPDHRITQQVHRAPRSRTRRS